MKNKTTLYLFLIFFITNIIDMITAFYVLPGESNPLYIITGNIYFLVLWKILIIGSLWLYIRRNIYPNNFSYYFIILITILGILLISLGAISNIYGIINPELIQQASTIPKIQKINAYFQLIGIIYILPIILSLLSFWLYDKSLNKTNINKQYFNKWWKL